MNEIPRGNEQSDWDSVYRSNFESAAFGPNKWVQHAVDLFESAKLFEPKIQEVWEYWRAKSQGQSTTHVADHFHGTYFMLMSFCVENLLKAALIQAKVSSYKRDFRSCLHADKKSSRCFPSELKTHDLFKLSEAAGLTLQDGEEDLLRRLSRCAEWAGRYPSPLRYEEMSGTEEFSDGEAYSLSWFCGGDVARLNDFIRSLPPRLGLQTRYWELKAE